MGICSSCESIPVATAKLILQEGQLVEFPFSVEVSYLLKKYPSCFICDSDSMEFDSFASAMHAKEELLPGHLYFSLPLSRLRYPLQPEEMAALAVKASLALMKSGSGGAYESCDGKEPQRGLNGDRFSSVGSGKCGRSWCKGRGLKFASSMFKLAVIPELE